MRGRWIGWGIAAALGLGAAASALGQSDAPLPKLKPKPAGGTILVVCDVGCTWTFDGKARGSLDAGESKKESVSLGQHRIDSATLDGLDKTAKEFEIKSSAQMIVHIELQPVRDARVKAERDAAAQRQREADAAAERQRQQERERADRESLAAEQEIWIDATTGLMWAKKDSGDNNELTWDQAAAYCRNLNLAGKSDWRLPTIGELAGIYDASLNVPFDCCHMRNNGEGIQGYMHVKGNLQLTGWEWSSSSGNASVETWIFHFYKGDRLSIKRIPSSTSRALCVRHP